MFPVTWRCAVRAPLRTTPAEELQEAFARRGYDVDPAATGAALTPPVTSFRVHDPQTRRALLVNIYEATGDAADEFERSPGVWYDASTWLGEVTVFELDQSLTEALDPGELEQNQ
jgi:hypothetical protein